MSKKVLIVGEGKNPSYHQPFREFGEAAYEVELLWTDPQSINLVVFTGGSDVSPALYGQEASNGTFTAPRRDIFEGVAYVKARSFNLRMAGICRGAQFLNVMAGGKLIQHIENHTQYHQMRTIEDEEFEVSSTHHQMIVPPEDHVLVGWSAKRRSGVYIGASNKHIKPFPEFETEAVYLPKIRAVGMQYHPEMMADNSDGFKFAEKMVAKYLFRKSH